MHGTFQMEHRLFRMFNEYPAGLSKLNALATSHKEYDAQLRFKVLYLLGQPRLGQVKTGRGTREITLFG